MSTPRWLMTVAAAALLGFGCGDDDDAVAADRFGVGAECTRDAECAQSLVDGGVPARCLLQFKGGYCGLQNCMQHADCPDGSACVVHDDGARYCFRSCTEKAECNANRTPDNESNCSSTVTYVDANKALGKACVPPSGK
jgi:hypothetical protein